MLGFCEEYWAYYYSNMRRFFKNTISYTIMHDHEDLRELEIIKDMKQRKKQKEITINESESMVTSLR